MNKLLALFDLFRKGSAVADPALWKNRQITVTILGMVFIAIGRAADAFGHPLPIDQATADAIAAGVIALANCLLTVTTSAKVGLPAKAEPNQPPTDDRGGNRKLEVPDSTFTPFTY